MSFTISPTLLKLMSTELVMPPNYYILCSHLLLLLSISQHQGHFQWCDFASGGQSIGASASASVPPMNIEVWFPLELTSLNSAFQGTLNSLLQCYNSKASILQHSTFFMDQLTQLCMTTGKAIDLTTWTFAGKVMSLLFDTLSNSHSFSSKEQIIP